MLLNIIGSLPIIPENIQETVKISSNFLPHQINAYLIIYLALKNLYGMEMISMENFLCSLIAAHFLFV